MFRLEIDWSKEKNNLFENGRITCRSFKDALDCAEFRIFIYGHAKRIDIFENNNLIASMRTVR